MFQQQFVDTLSATADSLTPVMQEQAAQMVQELSVWDLTMRGGFIMIPLAILSIISIYIFCLLYPSDAADDPTRLLSRGCRVC